MKEIFDVWNNLSALPRCLVVSDKRRLQLKARLGDPFFVDNWKEAMMRISASSFLTGINDRGWKATFDWFIQSDSVVKIMEGTYSGTTNHANNRNTGPDRNAGTFNAERVGQPISSKIR